LRLPYSPSYTGLRLILQGVDPAALEANCVTPFGLKPVEEFDRGARIGAAPCAGS